MKLQILSRAPKVRRSLSLSLSRFVRVNGSRQQFTEEECEVRRKMNE